MRGRRDQLINFSWAVFPQPATEIFLGLLHGMLSESVRPREQRGIKNNNQIVFSYQNRVNGSTEQIAGICNKDGNVVGMMPHPERAAEAIINPVDYKPSSLIFESLLKTLGVKN